MSCLNIPRFKNFEVHIFQSSSHARPISFGRIVCKLCRAGETCAKTLTGFEFLWAYSSARWQALPYRRRLAALLHSISFYHFWKISMSQYYSKGGSVEETLMYKFSPHSKFDFFPSVCVHVLCNIPKVIRLLNYSCLGFEFPAFPDLWCRRWFLKAIWIKLKNTKTQTTTAWKPSRSISTKIKIPPCWPKSISKCEHCKLDLFQRKQLFESEVWKGRFLFLLTMTTCFCF